MRLAHPEPAQSLTVMVVAAIGILVNGVTALLFASGRKRRSQRARRLPPYGGRCGGVGGRRGRGGPHAGHRLAVARSAREPPGLRGDRVGHLVAPRATRSPWRSTPCRRRSTRPAVRAFLVGLPGVDDLHDLHIWPMSTTEIALTAHLKMLGGHPGDAFLQRRRAAAGTSFRHRPSDAADRGRSSRAIASSRRTRWFSPGRGSGSGRHLGRKAWSTARARSASEKGLPSRGRPGSSPEGRSA